MKFIISLLSLALFVQVASATQLPESTFNEGESWMNNQLTIEDRVMVPSAQDFAQYSLADMIDMCLALEGFWNHSTNMCELRIVAPVAAAEPVMEEEMTEEVEAMEIEEAVEAVEEIVPVPNTSLWNSTFNEGETWFGNTLDY